MVAGAIATGARAIAGNLLLACASVAGFLLILELGAKLLGVRIGTPLLPAPFNCLQRSALLSMDFRPNCHGILSDTIFDTSSLGLRGPDIRDDGSARILAMGDSCTWGWRVPQDASYPAVLQQLLAARHGDGRYQVINAGIPGYTSLQGLLYLRERGLALRPAIVIFGYGFNDQTRLGDVERQLELERHLAPLMLLDDFLFQHSRIYDLVRIWTTATKSPGTPPRVDPEHFRRNLTEIVRLSRDQGAKVLGLSFSSTQHGLHGEALAGVRDTLAVPVVTYEGPRLDMVHPTVEGYQTLAAQILERLEQAHYLE